MTNSYIPEEFEITYKHDLNGTRSIMLVGNSLLVNNPNPEFIDIEQISEEKWIQFWEDLERIGLWDLEEEYQSCTLEGGFTWSVKIIYKSKELNSYGANMEPKIVIGDKVYSVLEELYKSIEEYRAILADEGKIKEIIKIILDFEKILVKKAKAHVPPDQGLPAVPRKATHPLLTNTATTLPSRPIRVKLTLL